MERRLYLGFLQVREGFACSSEGVLDGRKVYLRKQPVWEGEDRYKAIVVSVIEEPSKSLRDFITNSWGAFKKRRTATRKGRWEMLYVP